MCVTIFNTIDWIPHAFYFCEKKAQADLDKWTTLKNVLERKS